MVYPGISVSGDTQWLGLSRGKGSGIPCPLFVGKGAGNVGLRKRKNRLDEKPFLPTMSTPPTTMAEVR